MWAAGDAERSRLHHHYHHRETDKLRKIKEQDKLDKLDKLEKLEMMDGSDRVKHLEAQMLSQIRAMDLEPKMMDLYMNEEVRNSVAIYKETENHMSGIREESSMVLLYCVLAE